MRRLLAAAALSAFCLAAPARAQEASGAPTFRPAAPALSEALSVIRRADLLGVFLFVDPQEAPAAFAAYLLRDHKALKRYVKKAEDDLKKSRAVSRWDKYVFLHMVGMGVDGQGMSGADPLSPKWVARVQELTLAPSIPYDELIMRRGGK